MAKKIKKEVVPTKAKRDRFCDEYCLDFNGSKAAIRAGYSVKTARSIASELLTKPDIQARIKHLQANLAETAGISALMIVKEHAKMAFSNASKFRDGWMTLKDFNSLSDDDKGCVQEVTTKKTTKIVGEMEIEEEFVKVKLYDKQKSLDSLTTILGFNSPQKIDATISQNQIVLIEKTYEADEKAD